MNDPYRGDSFMKRLWFVLLVAACPAVALTQVPPGPGVPRGNPPPYQPAVPAASTINAYGGVPYYGGASTAAGSAMNGMASVISAKGDYNLSTSAAAVNMTEAERNEIQNRQLYTNTYFEMRATNQAARAAERGPNPTMEELVRIAHEGVPTSLSAKEFDAVAGKLLWPSALQQPSFASQCSEVDQLFIKFATYGGLPYSDQLQVRKTIDNMAGALKAQIRQIPPMDYVACRNFLRSVLYDVTKTVLQ
jgi:hypothetical protein